MVSIGTCKKTFRHSPRWGENIIQWVLMFCGSLSILTSLGIIAVLLYHTFDFFAEISLWHFLSDTQWSPLFSDKHFGILPLLCGTILTSLIAMLVALPLGLLSAIFLSEYARPRTRKLIKPVLEILAGIPTVVYGYFALLFVTPLLQKIFPNMSSFNALSAGLVMGVMLLPMISSLSEDALYAVPQSLREAAYALGSRKYQVSIHIAVPAAFSGITAACILAVSRAIGETMIVAIAAGQQARLSVDPLNPIQTMTAYIVQISMGDTPTGTLEYRTIFAVSMALFITTLFLNILSYRLRKRFREVYQ